MRDNAGGNGGKAGGTERRGGGERSRRRPAAVLGVLLVGAVLVAQQDAQSKLIDAPALLRDLQTLSADDMEEAAEAVERELAESGEKEVSSRLIGERVMARLEKLDGVAYVRFASVYKSFRDVDEFMTEMSELVRSRRTENK